MTSTLSSRIHYWTRDHIQRALAEEEAAVDFERFVPPTERACVTFHPVFASAFEQQSPKYAYDAVSSLKTCSAYWLGDDMNVLALFQRAETAGSAAGDQGEWMVRLYAMDATLVSTWSSEWHVPLAFDLLDKPLPTIKLPPLRHVLGHIARNMRVAYLSPYLFDSDGRAFSDEEIQLQMQSQPPFANRMRVYAASGPPPLMFLPVHHPKMAMVQQWLEARMGSPRKIGLGALGPKFYLAMPGYKWTFPLPQPLPSVCIPAMMRTQLRLARADAQGKHCIFELVLREFQDHHAQKLLVITMSVFAELVSLYAGQKTDMPSKIALFLQFLVDIHVPFAGFLVRASGIDNGSNVSIFLLQPSSHTITAAVHPAPLFRQEILPLHMERKKLMGMIAALRKTPHFSVNTSALVMEMEKQVRVIDQDILRFSS